MQRYEKPSKWASNFHENYHLLPHSSQKNELQLIIEIPFAVRANLDFTRETFALNIRIFLTKKYQTGAIEHENPTIGSRKSSAKQAPKHEKNGWNQ